MTEMSKEERKKQENFIKTLKAQAKEYNIDGLYTDPEAEKELQNTINELQKDIQKRSNTITNLEEDIDSNKKELDVVLKENANLKSQKTKEIEVFVKENTKLTNDLEVTKKDLKKTKRMLKEALKINDNEL